MPVALFVWRLPPRHCQERRDVAISWVSGYAEIATLLLALIYYINRSFFYSLTNTNPGYRQ
jgi:hypothetical protein